MLETTLGIVPDLGGTLPLVQTVGRARAIEMCLSGRRVGADEAVAVGLAHAAVDGAGLDDAAHALVDRLLVGPAGAVRETLALLSAAADGADPADQFADERAAQMRRIRSLAAGTG
jgi:enoyl-CoA hydratase/carnithine racemase